MSRIAKDPVVIPAGVEVKFEGQLVTVKGSVGTLSLDVHPTVEIKQEDSQLNFAPFEGEKSWALAGTTRALLNNMVVGVTKGFEKKLQLNGVG